MYINKVMLYGNLTRDPEVRAIPSGSNVCSFSIATNRVFKKADGSKQEDVQFHNIVVFGRTADLAAQYLKKGSALYVEGRLQTRTWDSPEKGKQYRTEVIADIIQFGPRAGVPGGPSTGGAPASSGYSDAEAPQKAPQEEGIDYPTEDINPDDIPF